MCSSCFRECGAFGKALMETAFPAGCMTPGSDKVSGKGERISFQCCFKPFEMTTHNMLVSTQKTFFSPSCNLLQMNIICMQHIIITIPNFTAIWLPVFLIPFFFIPYSLQQLLKNDSDEKLGITMINICVQEDSVAVLDTKSQILLRDIFK